MTMGYLLYLCISIGVATRAMAQKQVAEVINELHCDSCRDKATLVNDKSTVSYIYGTESRC